MSKRLAHPHVVIVVQLKNGMPFSDALSGETLNYEVPADWGFSRAVSWFADFQELVAAQHHEFVDTPLGGIIRPYAVERASLRVTFVEQQ